VMKIQVTIFWVVTPYSVVAVTKVSEGHASFFFRVNVDIIPHSLDSVTTQKTAA
jgi:hypothetical protein